MPTVTLVNSEQYEGASGTSLFDAAIGADFMLEDSGKTGRCSFSEARAATSRTLPLRPEEVPGQSGAAEGCSEHAVFLAIGTDIAPLSAIGEHLDSVSGAKRPASLAGYWVCRHTDDGHYWAPAENGLSVRLVPIAPRSQYDGSSARGHVNKVFTADAGNLRQTSAYACRSAVRFKSAQRELLAAGLPPRRFHSDAFVVSG